MKRLISFLKDWMLPIGMTAGALIYMLYRNLHFLAPAGPFCLNAITRIQPVLLFLMLFLTFCKIEPRQLKFQKWHLWLLLIQAGLFSILSTLLARTPDFSGKVVVEAAMLCLICPTATAAAVVTGKLGGDMAGLITYTILINLVTAILVPLFVPLIHPMEGRTFFSSFLMIVAKVFPLLICPSLLAWLVRYLLPGLHKRILKYPDLAFYIWAVSLTLAITMTVRSIYHSNVGVLLLSLIGLASLICCIFQFFAGKAIGRRYGMEITAGQSLGQKNTVFAIWMGYTFLSPVVSVAGGFYCIWHNCFNSWQLYKASNHEHAC